MKLTIKIGLLLALFCPITALASKQDTLLYISYYSRLYGVSEQRIYRTIECESGFRTDVRGDGGNSWGLAQIHLPSHPEITKEQAVTPAFAVEFISKEFSEGRARKWTCWRNLFNTPPKT